MYTARATCILLSLATLEASVFAFQPLAFGSPRFENFALAAQNVPPEPNKMNIAFENCFDNMCLVRRIREVKGKNGADRMNSKNRANSATVGVPRQTKMEELRSKSIKELKLECSRRSIRYESFQEREDFVQAIWKEINEVMGYSVSGSIRPGIATRVSGDQLEEELTNSDTPILVNFYARWCRQCTRTARQLDLAAAELGEKVRVVKLDTDRDPQWASKYNVQGLPITLLIHNGQVKKRVRGVAMKEDLLKLVSPYV